jgi:benzoyl-CoA reductase/2-hydroxyglutaryl-CoA dehydratase subunit BcrC/BadD/HgdB
VGLCAGAEFGFDKAEQYLPRSTCSLIKSFFGFTLEKVCPYIAASDLIVGENTCDGKKKAYEIFQDIVNRVYVMDLPQTKNPQGLGLLRSEYHRFAEEMQRLSGVEITPESLKRGIEIVNAKRQAMHRLAALRQADPSPISGLDALLVNQVFFYDDPQRFTQSIHALCDELEQRITDAQGVFAKGTPRILVSGCPMAAPNWKLPSIVEKAGAVIVGEESCVGERGTQFLTDQSGETVDAMIDAIADRYFQINCAIFTPNPTRLTHIQELARKYHADGVIHYGLQFCAPYQIESHVVERELEAKSLPVLRIDTDYSMEDVEQLRTRIEAFIERLRG